MDKLKDVLLLVAGLALLPIVSGLSFIGDNIAMWVAGLGIGIAGLLGLLNK